MKFKIIYIIVGLFFSIAAFAQTDTEFWFAAPAITAGHENKPIVFRITSYDHPAVVTISEPANGAFNPIVISLASNATFTQDLTAYINAIENKPSGTVLNKGIKITSTAFISVYYEVGQNINPEIFPLKGVSAKGNSFIIPSQTTFNNQPALNPVPNNGFVIIATEDNTTVNITLTKNDGNGHTPGTFTITLNKGQTYAVIGSSTAANLHLGGTQVIADKAICITIYDDSILVGGSFDLAGDQIVPINNSGTEFIIVRGALSTASNTNTDFFYIWATEDGTNIYLNGSAVATTTINKGSFYRGLLSSNSVYVTSSKPIYILQFTGVATEVAETSLPSIKCTGSNTVSFVRSTSESFYLNLICKAVDVDNFTLNGVAGIITSNLFFDVPGATGWKAARISVANLPNFNALVPNGVATMVSNSTGLFHLGFLNGGSSSGARLGYFSNYSKVVMAPNLITTTCFGSNIQLEAKYLNSVSYSWTGPNNFSSVIYNPIIPNARVIDSGFYYLQASIPGCGISIDSIHITVNPLPTIQLVKSLDTICIGNVSNINYILTGKSPWNLVYTDGVKMDTIKNILVATNHFSVNPLQSTIYRIKNLIDSNACNLDSVNNVVLDTLLISKLPVANFNISTIQCEKNAILFTDTSIADIDPIVKWNWKMGDGAVLNYFNNNPFNYTYVNWGKDSIRLSLESSLGCKSDTLLKVININPLPLIGFTIPNVCLDGGLAVFKDTSTYKASPTPFTYLWNFNASTLPITPGPTYDNLQSISSNPSVLYNKEGNYSVKLMVTSSDGCMDTLSKSFIINGSNPIANFAILKDTALCSNQDVVIQDSSWVYPGNIGLLQVYWGDGKDTIINNSKIGNLYHHDYLNTVAVNNFNYNIKIKAFSGGTCLNEVVKQIHIIPPPSNVTLQSTQNDICLYDSLKVHTNILGGLGPLTTLISSNNRNVYVKDSMVTALNAGTVNFNIQVTDSKKCIYDYSNLLSLTIRSLPIATLIVKDTIICNGDSVTLKGQGASVYKWFNNNNLFAINNIDSLKIANVGNYSLVVNDGKCNSLATNTNKIIAFNIPIYNFSYNPLSCINGDLLIQTSAADKLKMHYVWDFGDSSYFNYANPVMHSYKQSGKFIIKLNVTNDFCPKYNYAIIGDTIRIVNPPDSATFTLFVLADQDTLLSSKKIDSGYINYTWSPQRNLSNPYIPNPVFRGNNNMDYTLLRMNPNTGCKIYDNYHLEVSNDLFVIVPKAFTPNNDNLNDQIKIEYGAGVKTLNRFVIFNRFGKIVFETNDISQGWDGRVNGFDQEMDAYTYFIDFVTYKDIPIKKTGSFILLR